MYENGALRAATGGVLRPGGMELTRRIIALSELSPGARVLDIGCGCGDTLRYLEKSFMVSAAGADVSRQRLRAAKETFPELKLIHARGGQLGIATGCMDVILAECSFSAMTGSDEVLCELWRVLRPGGRLAMTDLYARNAQGVPALQGLPLGSGVRHVQTCEELQSRLRSRGFDILAWEDHSPMLKILAAQAILSHGSMCEFWRCSEPDVDPLELQIAVGKAKLGYYLMVAEKRSDMDDGCF